MIKGIIFDLDGVIISTDKYHYEAWKAIADKEGIYFDEEINNRLRGVSRMASLEIILEKANKIYTDEEKQALAEEKNNIYRSLLSNLSPKDLPKDVKQAIKKLYEDGYHLAIASSSKNTKYILERLDITNAFDIIIDGSMIVNSKPDPEVFLLAQKGLGYTSRECIVVEDAKAGIDAAKAGNFLAVGISDASKYEKTDYPINSLLDLFNVIEDANKKVSHKIDIEHVGKVYNQGNVRAVNDFNLTIDDGEFVVFVGPSGCGKSTVLRMIAGLEEITEGEIYMDGKLLNYLDPKDRNTAMVFQNYALYPHLTVRKNIAFPLSQAKIPLRHFFNFKYRKERKDHINSLVEEAASKINLTPYLDRKPANLSGGQRQRVALGRAIVRNPEVFLLDEPLSNLDAKMRAQMRTEITRLHNELKTVFIYVTHDQVEAMTMGTKIVVMKDGVIQQVASPDELYLNPTNMFVAGFIGTPQMNFIDAVVTKVNKKYFAKFLNSSEGVEIPLARMKTFNEEYLDTPIIMGIRPKAISIKGDLAFKEQGFKAKVNLFEKLGDNTIIYGSVDGLNNELIASIEGIKSFTVGEEVDISFNLDNVCFFDKDKHNTIL